MKIKRFMFDIIYKFLSDISKNLNTFCLNLKKNENIYTYYYLTDVMIMK